MLTHSVCTSEAYLIESDVFFFANDRIWCSCVRIFSAQNTKSKLDYNIFTHFIYCGDALWQKEYVWLRRSGKKTPNRIVAIAFPYGGISIQVASAVRAWLLQCAQEDCYRVRIQWFCSIAFVRTEWLCTWTRTRSVNQAFFCSRDARLYHLQSNASPANERLLCRDKGIWNRPPESLHDSTHTPGYWIIDSINAAQHRKCAEKNAETEHRRYEKLKIIRNLASDENSETLELLKNAGIVKWICCIWLNG